MNPEVARLRAQIAADRLAVTRHLAELEALNPADGDAGTAARAALALHHAYAGVETILERCMVMFEGSRPTGADSHRAILDAATLDIPGVRAALLSKAVVRPLHELRSFRHFLHHGYAAELDPGRLEALRHSALALRGALNADLDALDARLAEIAEIR